MSASDADVQLKSEGRSVSTNTRRFNTVQGIAVAALAGVAMWTLLVGVTMWAVTA